MSNHLFAALYVGAVGMWAWLWRIAQESNWVPFWLRMPVGVLSVAVFVWWLTRRLDRAGGAR